MAEEKSGKIIINGMEVTGTVAVDQQFNPESPNAVSAKAVNGVLENIRIIDDTERLIGKYGPQDLYRRVFNKNLVESNNIVATVLTDAVHIFDLVSFTGYAYINGEYYALPFNNGNVIINLKKDSQNVFVEHKCPVVANAYFIIEYTKK